MDEKKLLFEMRSPQLYGEQYEDIVTYWLPSARRVRLRVMNKIESYDYSHFTESGIIKVNSDGSFVFSCDINR